MELYRHAYDRAKPLKTLDTSFKNQPFERYRKAERKELFLEKPVLARNGKRDFILDSL